MCLLHELKHVDNRSQPLAVCDMQTTGDFCSVILFESWLVLTASRGYGWCPYYAARRLIQASSVVVLNYQCMP